jgi:hypothetical protein
MRPWMYNRQDKSSKAFPAFTGRASFKPIGVHQMTVMAAMGRDDDGALQVPSGQKLWHLFPDNLRHCDIYFSPVPHSLRSTLPFSLLLQ